MHRLTFYPLGNADCCLIDLNGGKMILFDYANTRDPNDYEDLRCDLPELILEHLESENRDYFDVVAFTHLDKDHYKGATEFFWLDHAKKYQDENRIRINTLWVPSAFITETSLDAHEARVLQKETRHRFKEGTGIRVFSRPNRLREWCDDNHIDLDDRLNLITDAGQVVPEFSLVRDEVEFFVHSPFAKRLNEEEVEDRNDDAIVMQATFSIQEVYTRVLLLADADHEVLSDIVEVTRDKKTRPEHLTWEVAKLPHHCSYLSLGPEKGEDKTEPVENTRWLWEDQGQEHGIIVSTSNPIPLKDSEEDEDSNPPHRQAANYYREVVGDLEGDFAVTMEHPKKSDPKPLVIEIDASRATLKKVSLTAAAVATSRSTPRAG